MRSRALFSFALVRSNGYNVTLHWSSRLYFPLPYLWWWSRSWNFNSRSLQSLRRGFTSVCLALNLCFFYGGGQIDLQGRGQVCVLLLVLLVLLRYGTLVNLARYVLLLHDGLAQYLVAPVSCHKLGQIKLLRTDCPGAEQFAIAKCLRANHLFIWVHNLVEEALALPTFSAKGLRCTIGVCAEKFSDKVVFEHVSREELTQNEEGPV